jgi:hypothetical protein
VNALPGILVFLLFLLLGVLQLKPFLKNCNPLFSLWLGLGLGMAEMLWFPSLFAFFMGFTVSAQWWAIALSALLSLAAIAFGRRAKPLFCAQNPSPKILFLVLPLAIVSLYLLHTHTLRDVGGALHVGQSTYGDLCLHVGIATGLLNAPYPPEYTILPGTRLGYPFLTDALSASMLLFGSTLRQAFILPQFVQMLLVYTGFAIFAEKLTGRFSAAAVAFLLLFLNGGLGFFYLLDDSEMLHSALFGFYQAPCNMPALNLRWSNLLCDLFIPQRTFLAGWTMLIPALYLLVLLPESEDRRLPFALGIWAGAMPMVHTHSFLALGVISAGIMAHSLWKAQRRTEVLGQFLRYGIAAVVVALPQLLLWTFPQTLSGGSLRILFNWVNNENGSFIDSYFWFWIKNVGIAYLLIVPAALSSDARGKSLALGALLLYILAECVVFQMNVYDNNKLFYVAYMAVLPPVAQYALRVYDGMKPLSGRRFLAGVFLFVCLASGTISVARECISDYELFSAGEAEAAQWIAGETDRETDVFLTAQQHNNAVSTLSGRKIVCGTGSYLYFHGVDYAAQADAARRMFEEPAASEALFAEYGVTYIYLSHNERSAFSADADWFAENCDVAFQNADVIVYRYKNRSS